MNHRMGSWYRVVILATGVVVGAVALPLGPAVANAVQDVFVTNTDTSPVPVRPISEPASKSEGIHEDGTYPKKIFAGFYILSPLQERTFSSSEFAMRASLITVYSSKPARFAFSGPDPVEVVAEGSMAIPLTQPITTNRDVTVACMSEQFACRVQFWITGSAGIS